MASKTKQSERDRRAKIEAMRQAEQARQRRRSWIFLSIAMVVGLALVAAVVVPSYLSSRNDPAKKALSAFGVSAADASCSPVHTTPGTNTQALRTHVQDGTVEKYATVPPSFGPHWSQPIYPAREFYTARDRPEMEQLVHNLEHGYTILWYDQTVADSDAMMDDLRGIASKKSSTTNLRDKFKAVPWTDEDGDPFPSGQHVAMTHWSVGGADAGQEGKQVGVFQYCSAPSGEALDEFMKKYPYMDSPEPTVL